MRDVAIDELHFLMTWGLLLSIDQVLVPMIRGNLFFTAQPGNQLFSRSVTLLPSATTIDEPEGEWLHNQLVDWLDPSPLHEETTLIFSLLSSFFYLLDASQSALRRESSPSYGDSP